MSFSTQPDCQLSGESIDERSEANTLHDATDTDLDPFPVEFFDGRASGIEPSCRAAPYPRDYRHRIVSAGILCMM